MQHKNKIPAVFKEDLKQLLRSIGEIDPINNGDRVCLSCTKLITIENMQMIIPRKNNRYEYICNDSLCIRNIDSQKEIK
jgi:hypothetical protein